MTRYQPLYMQEGSYPAQLDRWVINDVFGSSSSGVLLSGTGAFAVTQHAAGANMSVDVAPGRATVPGTSIANQAAYSIWSDAVENPAIATAPGAGQSRIDLIVAQVRDDFVVGGGNNDFIITAITGTAATTGSQVAPAAPASSLVLAQVLVGPNVTSIVNANITDVRPRPYVSSTTGGIQMFSTTVGPPTVAGSPYTITHNLNTTAPIVQVWDTVTNQLIQMQVTIVDANHVTISVAQNLANIVRVVVTGGTGGGYVPAYQSSYVQTLTAPTVAGSPYTITHNLNTWTPIVQVWDTITGLLVQVQVKATSNNAIQLSVTANMPNAVNVVVLGTPASAVPVNPPDTVTKAYADAKLSFVDYVMSAVLPAYTSGAGGVLTATTNAVLVVDGSNMAANYRILYTAGAAGVSGRYTVTQPGSATTPWILTPIADPTGVTTSDGALIWCYGGNVWAKTLWIESLSQYQLVSGEGTGLPAPVTSGSTIQSYTDQTGEVWVAKNGVAGGVWKRARDVLYCNYYRNAAWTAPTAWTNFAFDTAFSDAYGMYNTATGLFAPPVAGLWTMYAYLTVNPTATSGIHFDVSLYDMTSAAYFVTATGFGNATTWGIGAVAQWQGPLTTTYSITARNLCSNAFRGQAGNAYSNGLRIAYLGTG